jgi:hypothetical protein
MSHFSKIQTQLSDKTHLFSALKDLGFTAEEGDLSVMGYTGRQAAVEIRIPLHQSCDIGFRKSGNTYEIVADWAGIQGLQAEEFTQNLTQRYAYHAACAKLAEQGFTLVEEQHQESGQIHLVMRRLSA